MNMFRISSTIKLFNRFPKYDLLRLNNRRNFRVNPLFWGPIYDDWYKSNNLSELKDSFDKVKPKDVIPKEASVSVTGPYIAVHHLYSVVEFETPNSNHNIWSLDLLFKLYRTLSDLKGRDFVVVRSSKPDQFIMDDDIEYIQALSPEAFKLYYNIQKLVMAIIMTDLPPILVYVDGPCMNGGLEFVLTCFGKVAKNSPNVYFGLNTHKHGYPPLGYGMYKIFGKANYGLSYGALSENYRFTTYEAFYNGFIDEIVPHKKFRNTNQDILFEEIKNANNRDILEAFSEKIDSKFVVEKNWFYEHEEASVIWKDKISSRIFLVLTISSLTFIPFFARLALVRLAIHKNFDEETYEIFVYALRFYLRSYNIDHKREKVLKKAEKCDNKYFSKPSSSAKRLLALNEFKQKLEVSSSMSSLDDQKISIYADMDTTMALSMLDSMASCKPLDYKIQFSDLNWKINIISNVNKAHSNYLPPIYPYTTVMSQGKITTPSLSDIECHSQFKNEFSTFTSDKSELKSSNIVFCSKESFDGKKVKDIEGLLSQDTMVAVCSSYTPIETVAQGCKNLENIVGLNYSPSPLNTRLLEVIPLQNTKEDVIQKAFEIAHSQHKIPMKVKDSPGFYSTRVLSVVLKEVLSQLEKGYSPFRMDNSFRSKRFQYPYVSLIDYIGIDVLYDTLKYLNSAMDLNASLTLLQNLKDKSALGVKSNMGIYLYEKPCPFISPIHPKQTSKHFPTSSLSFTRSYDLSTFYRLLILNESVKCLEEGIIASPGQVDVAATAGIVGFPHFLGGPCKFFDDYPNRPTISKQLDFFYESTKSPSFVPSKLLLKMLENNEKFYP